MSFKMQAKSNDFEQVPEGTYGAVCVGLIDLGTQDGHFGPKRQILLRFEIDENMKDGRRYLVSARKTLSFHEKASLRQLVEGWRGKRFAEGEPFDLHKLAGQPCMLSLVENDKGYINVASIAKLPKGMTPIEPQGQVQVLDMDAPDWDVLSQLSEKLQEIIEQSPEYGAAMSDHNQRGRAGPQKAPAGEGPGPEPSEDFDDDIPF